MCQILPHLVFFYFQYLIKSDKEIYNYFALLYILHSIKEKSVRYTPNNIYKRTQTTVSDTYSSYLQQVLTFKHVWVINFLCGIRLVLLRYLHIRMNILGHLGIIYLYTEALPVGWYQLLDHIMYKDISINLYWSIYNAIG